MSACRDLQASKDLGERLGIENVELGTEVKRFKLAEQQMSSIMVC